VFPFIPGVARRASQVPPPPLYAASFTEGLGIGHFQARADSPVPPHRGRRERALAVSGAQPRRRAPGGFPVLTDQKGSASSSSSGSRGRASYRAHRCADSAWTASARARLTSSWTSPISDQMT
jgi:hypothetical protein